MTDTNGNLVMPVAPMGNYGNGGGFGFGDMGSGWWLILLLICLGGCGNGFGFGGGFGGGAAGPMMVNNDVQRGFDQSALISGITGVQNAVTSGFGDMQTALCGGFANVNSNIANGFAQAQIADNAREIASMQQGFAAQMATQQGFNGVQSQLASCCCDNRLATSEQTATILAEHCADRQAFSDGVRDILTNQNMGVQRILDQMCSDKIDSKNEKIADLERQIAALNSNNYIQNALTSQTQFILSRYPVPAATTPAA